MQGGRDSNGKRPAEVLEVEDEEQRQERMHSLLSKLNTRSNPGLSAPNGLQTLFDTGDKDIFPTGPPSDLLKRAQAFLPELAASNADLIRRARENPESVDIENVGEDAERYIEMNLGLGVFEHRGEVPPGIPVADVDLESRMQDSDSDTSSGSTDDSNISSSASSDSSDDPTSSDESDSEQDKVDSPEKRQDSRPKKSLPKRVPVEASKPDIVVLSETVGDSTAPS
ncbi:hypothetical protein BN946_scf184937.g19 [Trametes cinnabarina]|uniref:Uncharacterized protein n=1 Tax=Pycnoporus cinnabarinus TaxID=5643 RepID=A0A060SPW6_PYCCI|nr:hypothetical protein BN946_scf184937.g19 [Trametes cinnabarina]